MKPDSSTIRLVASTGLDVESVPDLTIARIDLSQPSRPRIAIIGGGGAMGRLFARLFVGRARDITLIDLFGYGPRQASVSLTLDDVRTSAAAKGLVASVVGLTPTGDSVDLWRLTVEPDDGRAIALLRSPSCSQPIVVDSAAIPRPLADLLDGLPDGSGDGSQILVVHPADVASVLGRADVILLALRFESPAAFAQVIDNYRPWIRHGSLVVDLGSIKTLPMEVLSRELDPAVGLLGAHPLFGPNVSDLSGLIVAVVDPLDQRETSAWRGWFLDQLADLRMIVTPASAIAHDDAMAFVQSLTHFVLLAYAYTFVRLDRDPADLLALRTPVFEPLLYLAARVASQARSNPDTYRSIQLFSARPDARAAFMDSARELLDAIDGLSTSEPSDGALKPADALIEMFRRYGSPWSLDGKDRRDRQRREHFLEMGAGLVDDLNRRRQELVSAVGEVRGVEERRSGQPLRVVVGIVDVDLLDPGKQDVATRIRLRRLNLALGSVRGGLTADPNSAVESGQHEIIPLARARFLTDDELVEWLFMSGQLVEERTSTLVTPAWFDRETLRRLVVGQSSGSEGVVIRDVSLQPSADAATDSGSRLGLLTLTVVTHPGRIVALRQEAQRFGADQFRAGLAAVDAALAVARRGDESAIDPAERTVARREKDRLKHERKALVDRRTTEIDRDVRRSVRALVQQHCDETVNWLVSHGCRRPPRPGASFADSDGPAILSDSPTTNG